MTLDPEIEDNINRSCESFCRQVRGEAAEEDTSKEAAILIGQSGQMRLRSFWFVRTRQSAGRQATFIILYHATSPGRHTLRIPADKLTLYI